MKRMILTVDDSPSVRKMVEFTLKAKGYGMEGAENGVEAYECLQEEEFDAIILDINMPLMNGLEFLEKIKQEPRFASIPVIMLTTEGQEGDKNKSLSLGATVYIVKPFKPTQLLSLVADVLPKS